jgi:hypothetical protein
MSAVRSKRKKIQQVQAGLLMLPPWSPTEHVISSMAMRMFCKGSPLHLTYGSSAGARGDFQNPTPKGSGRGRGHGSSVIRPVPKVALRFSRGLPGRLQDWRVKRSASAEYV